MEFRINAEDPFNGFVPTPGVITHLRVPAGPGIRVDSGVEEGGVVPMEYDPLVLKIIIHGKDRRHVIRRAKRALEELEVAGIYTTLPFHLWLLANPDFVEGRVHTSLAEGFQTEEEEISPEEAVAVAAAYTELVKHHSPLFTMSENSVWRLKGRWHSLKRRKEV